MPVFSAFFLFFALSSMGLPGLNNFVGEVLILIGTFQAWPLIAILSFVGIIMGVIYILRMVQDCLFGEARQERNLMGRQPPGDIYSGTHGFAGAVHRPAPGPDIAIV